MISTGVEEPYSTEKCSYREFIFSNDEEEDCVQTEESLRVIIPEIVHPQYGMYTWPSAPVLAQYIWHHRRDMKGKIILELGAGTALPAIVAAKCQAEVVVSDTSRLPSCLEHCKNCCLANGLADIKVIGITWGTFGPELLSLKHLNYVIASDCFYDYQDFENIIATVALLLDRNPGCQFLFSYQVRSTNWIISDFLSKWNLSCNNIPLAFFGADSPHLATSNLPGRHTIQMLRVVKHGCDSEK